MKLWVHYQISDGAIVGWENSPEHCVSMEGIGSVAMTAETPPDSKRQKVDLVSLEIVAMTPRESEIANAPTLHEVRSLVATELSDSDIYFSVSDFPSMTDELRTAWRLYRQSLRDLSKLDGPLAQIRAWPARPDGIDAVAGLRLRLPKC